ncbi:MAG TPA: hypothetical protein PK228_21670 [Saprospiraceae bacterium]|nr:hypothetical protein [Saprospiraceae bacterium]
MKKQLLILVLLTVQVVSLAGQDCYPRFMREGKDAFEGGNFEKAKNSFEAARICADRPAGDTEADQWLEKTINGYIAAIERERKKAEDNAAQAGRNARVAEAGRLALLANNAMNQDSNEVALALAFLAVETLPDNPDPSARQTFAEAAYHQTRQVIRPEEAQLKNGYFYNCAFSTDGSIMMAIAGADRLVLYDKNTSPASNWFVQLPVECTAAAISPVTRLVAVGGKDGSIHLLNTTNRTMSTFYQRPGTVTSLAWSTQGEGLAAGYRDGSIVMLASENTVHAETAAHAAPVYGLAFSPDGSLLLSRSADMNVKLWNIELSKPVAIATGDVYPSHAVFPANDQVLIAGADGQMALWDDEGQNQRRLDKADRQICLTAFDREKDRIMTVSTDHSVLVWNAQGQLLETVELSGEKIFGASLSAAPPGYLVTCSAKELYLWEWQKKSLALRLPVSESGITSVVLSPVGDRIAIVRQDGALELFETPYFAFERLKTNPPVFSPEQKIRYGIK